MIAVRRDRVISCDTGFVGWTESYLQHCVFYSALFNSNSSAGSPALAEVCALMSAILVSIKCEDLFSLCVCAAFVCMLQ